MSGLLYFLLGTQAGKVPANNIILLMLAMGGGAILAIVLIVSWVLLYRFFPETIASPYPNLFLGEDPHRRRWHQ